MDANGRDLRWQGNSETRFHRDSQAPQTQETSLGRNSFC